MAVSMLIPGLDQAAIFFYYQRTQMQQDNTGY